MTALLQLTFLAFAIRGIHEVTRDEEIFGFVERFWDSIGKNRYKSGFPGVHDTFETFIPWYAAPITECPLCMSSFWSAVYVPFIFIGGLPLTIATICLAPFAVAGIGWLIGKGGEE